MSFLVLPPEINSLRMFIGAGSAPMLDAAAARPWRQRVNGDCRFIMMRTYDVMMPRCVPQSISTTSCWQKRKF
jgi:hypothetical protein